MPENIFEYKKLPDSLRHVIRNLLEHRNNIWETFRIVGVTYSALAACYAIPVHAFSEGTTKNALQMIGGIVFLGGLGAGTKLLLSHNNAFRKEHLDVFTELGKHKNHSELKEFLKKYRYVVIDKKGNLVGKTTAPHILRIPLGRRRIASPFTTKKERKKWKKTLPTKMPR